jgi:hypothetical protein
VRRHLRRQCARPSIGEHARSDAVAVLNDQLPAVNNVLRDLTPDRESPALPLTMLDPVIADAALPLWNVGKYRQAVNDAATNLNVFAQQRLGARPMMKTGFPCHAGERCRSRCPPYDVRETLGPAGRAGMRAETTT